MIKKFLIVVAILLLATFYILHTTPVHAAEDPSIHSGQEFATNYDVTYDMDESGVTTVTEKVTLRNLTSLSYAKEFKLTIGATQISDVRADDNGPAQTKVEQKDTSTIITVIFNQQVAGLGKQFSWTLIFKSPDFAQKHGKVWEISVPKISSAAVLESYNLVVSTPFSYGEPTSISPTPKSQSSSGGKRLLIFNKEQLLKSGVFANFGTFQLFDFDLTFNLENNNLVPILTNIALPPDTAYQDVIYSRIDPKPLNVTVDSDGNYLAWYRLARMEKLSIKVIGSTKLYTNSKVKNPSLSSDLSAQYTKTDLYWDKDNPAIKTKLTEVLGASSSASNMEKAKLIHRFVAGTLKYDSSRLSGSSIDRLGAVTALNNPNSAVCMEYTDLFIALARAAGIPARELDGFAYTANPKLRPLSLSRDILHAWPEFWDESRGWVMVDPTWESTTGGVDYFDKFDLNHFVFAIKGSSSQQPVPAGSYKYLGQDSHDVKVNLSEADFIAKPQLNIEIESPSPIIAGFPEKITVVVTNNGNGLQSSQDLKISSGKLTILENQSRSLGPIPAFGQARFEYNVRTKSLLENYDDTIEVTVGGQKVTKNVSVKPFLQSQLSPFLIIALVILLGLIYVAILGVFIYRKRVLKKKSDTIHSK